MSCFISIRFHAGSDYLAIFGSNSRRLFLFTLLSLRFLLFYLSYFPSQCRFANKFDIAIRVHFVLPNDQLLPLIIKNCMKSLFAFCLKAFNCDRTGNFLAILQHVLNMVPSLFRPVYANYLQC